MKKINKTWVFIVILIILTGILLAVSIYTKDAKPETKIAPAITSQSEKEIAFTTLKISDEPRISTISGTYEVDIIIDTNKNEVTLAQLELSYDPSTLRISDIKPGSFLEEPSEIQKNIDKENGRISYWLSINPNQRWIQGSGAIATILFTKFGTESAQIEFAPKSSVNALGTDNSVLKEALPGFIYNLPTKTPIPTRIPLPSPTPEI